MTDADTTAVPDDPGADDPVLAELGRAEGFLTNLHHRALDVVTIDSPSAEDAPFLGRNISKLSPFVSNLIERQVVQELAEELDPGGGFHWVRQDPGWPDAGLFRVGELVGGFEVKAWYVLATEMTGRFHAAQSAIEGLHARVIVVPWVMSQIVYGSPVLLGHIAVDAMELAQQRDAWYHRPPDRIVVEPPDQANRAANLRQTNVIGQKMQRVSDEQMATARMFVERFGVAPVPHADDTRALNEYLVSNYPYREESNFGKLGRTFFEPLREFEVATLATDYFGRSLAAWRIVLAQLDDPVDANRTAAERAVAALYLDEADADDPEEVVGE